MIIEWAEIMSLQKLKKKERKLREGDGERGQYGYLLRSILMKYIK